ncbi:putative phosphodiesterase [Pseudomonas sp. BIGb0408]|uniref:Putative phosphodiesterase n=1 Tax=Phytopseudomonas flavescens TaxID=29435 RepID=A0A7Y9XJB4_9GAMM|nr:MULTISPECIES: metallophosphoesterase [Pseudomonas]MCW2293133.1 putative phosphodiesterase [Pseudomonas sp. BIGb0408]NYH72297.1 putative phosphodiesterase [Pseudomonas flavescens]
MRVHVLSDLHIEFSGFKPEVHDADLVILAGDIHTLTRGVKWANEVFDCDVVYVMGNHEFYRGHLDRTLAKARECAAPHVHILEADSFIRDGVRFLGTTGWADFSISGDSQAAVREALDGMNDYKLIRFGDSYRKLRPADVIKRNRSSHDWLKSELAKDFDGKTVVISHHAPLACILGEEPVGHLSASYANNWPELVAKADAWIFGHTHDAINDEFYGCRVISNPRGYPGEDTGFNPSFVIDL